MCESYYIHFLHGSCPCSLAREQGWWGWDFSLLRDKVNPGLTKVRHRCVLEASTGDSHSLEKTEQVPRCELPRTLRSSSRGCPSAIQDPKVFTQVGLQANLEAKPDPHQCVRPFLL